MKYKSQGQVAIDVEVAMWRRSIAWQNCVFLQKHLNNFSCVNSLLSPAPGEAQTCKPRAIMCFGESGVFGA